MLEALVSLYTDVTYFVAGNYFYGEFVLFLTAKLPTNDSEYAQTLAIQDVDFEVCDEVLRKVRKDLAISNYTPNRLFSASAIS